MPSCRRCLVLSVHDVSLPHGVLPGLSAASALAADEAGGDVAVESAAAAASEAPAQVEK